MASMKLELVSVPVSDIDRAKTFYTEKVGFHLGVCAAEPAIEDSVPAQTPNAPVRAR